MTKENFNRSRHENATPKGQLHFTIKLSFIETDKKGEFVRCVANDVFVFFPVSVHGVLRPKKVAFGKETEKREEKKSHINIPYD